MASSFDWGSRAALRARYQASSTVGHPSPGMAQSSSTVVPSGRLPRLPIFQSPWRNVRGQARSAPTSGEGSAARASTASATSGASDG